MKKTFMVSMIVGTFMVSACGPSAEEIAAREKAVADSIAAVAAEAEAAQKAAAEAEAAAAAAAAAEAEAAAQKAIADSIEAANSKGGKKKK